MNTGAVVVRVQTRASCCPQVTVENNRPTGLIEKLLQSDAHNVRRNVGMLYGLCPIAHLAALDGSAATALVPPQLLRRAVTLEAVAENLRMFITAGADIAQMPTDIAALRELGGIRAVLMGVLAALISAPDKEALAKAEEGIVLAQSRLPALFAHALLADSEAFLALECPADFDAWLDASTSPARALLKALNALPAHFGCVTVPFLPHGDAALKETLLLALSQDPSLEMNPRLAGKAALTGALSRTHKVPLLQALVAERGVTPLTLTLARLRETLTLGAALAAGNTAEEALLNVTVFRTDSGSSITLVESARGLLAHARGATQHDGLPAFYRVTSPTEWQFAKAGAAQEALESALSCTPLPKEGEVAEQRALASLTETALFGLDPCVPIQLFLDGRSVPLSRS